MIFEDFIGQGKVRKGMPDIPKIRSLMQTSKNHLEFLKDQKITEISSGSILVTYYEALREILEALCLKQGYKVYSHEAFAFFLKKLKEDQISVKFDNLRKLRNSVNYYWEKVDIEEVEFAKQTVIKLIFILKNKYLFDFLNNRFDWEKVVYSFN